MVMSSSEGKKVIMASGVKRRLKIIFISIPLLAFRFKVGSSVMKYCVNSLSASILASPSIS